MRYESIKFHGFGPFHDEVSLDFAAIPGPLIAVCGANGAGKSSLLELLDAAAERECPTRGSLAKLATVRGASLEARVVNGQPWAIRHVVDNVSGKGESFVTDAVGAPALPDTKITSFDEWSARTLPPKSLRHISTFAAQQADTFLKLKPAERKSALLRLVGAEHLEALAKRARENAAGSHADLNIADARLRDEQSRARPITESTESLVRSREALAGYEREVERAETALAALRAEAEAVARSNDAVMRAGAERITAEESKAAAEARANGLIDRAIALRATAEGAEAARQARDYLAELDGKVAALREQLASLEAEAKTTVDRRRASEVARDRAKARAQQLAKEQIDQAYAYGARDRLLSESAGLEADEAALPNARRELEEARAEAERVADVGTDVDSRRIGVLRSGCEYYLKGQDDGATAYQALCNDDAILAELRDRPGLLRAAIERRAVAFEHVEGITAAIARKQLARARADSSTGRAAEEISAELLSVKAEAEEHEGALRALAVTGDPQLTTVRGDLQALAVSRAPIARTAALLPEAERAATLCEEIDRQVAAAEREAEAAATRLAELEARTVPELRPMPDVSGAERQLSGAREALSGARVAVSLAEREHAEAVASAARIEALTVERSAAEESLGDWNRIASDLDGVRSAEIDSAGPELTALTNELLHECVGPRFTVTIDTQRASADGKRTIETCEVTVLDSQEGREGPAETFSGGEVVMIGEAVSLALSVLACRRWGIDGCTLIRDETGAALDPVRARAYVDMLRRAGNLIGVHRILFVSHSPELQELADSRILIADGKVTVQ